MKFIKTQGTGRRRSDCACLVNNVPSCLSVRPEITKYKRSDVFRRSPKGKSRDLPQGGEWSSLLNTFSHNSTPAHVFMSCCITEYRENNLCSHYTVRCISIYSRGCGELISSYNFTKRGSWEAYNSLASQGNCPPLAQLHSVYKCQRPALFSNQIIPAQKLQALFTSLA
jgi:hypothetical protein